MTEYPSIGEAIGAAMAHNARLAAEPPPADPGLRDRIAAAIWERQNPGRRYADCEHPWQADAEADADAVLAVLPEPADRAAVLLEAATRYEEMLAKATPEQDPRYWTAVRDVTLGLRRMAAEADDTIHACPGRWAGPDCRCFDTDAQPTCIHPDGYDGECPCPSSCGCCTVTAPADPNPRDRIAQALADADGWQWAEGAKETSPAWRSYQERAEAALAAHTALPAPVALPEDADRNLRDRIARALAEVTVGHKAFITADVEAEYPRADTVLAVLPAPSVVAQATVRAIHALRTPAPAGSAHYRNGFADGLDAAMTTARDTVLRQLGGRTQTDHEFVPDAPRAPGLCAACGDSRAWHRRTTDQAQQPGEPDPESLVHVGWWCWSGGNHGHLATQACRSDNVPLHVPAEWADQMRAVIQRIEDGDGPETTDPVCGECGHPRTEHEEGDDPVTPGTCTACDDDRHDFQEARNG